MLAPPEKAEQPAALPAEEKRRTITLTNARPVVILESQWPVVAEGKYSDCHPSGDPELNIDFRVRMGKYDRYLIHGKFSYSDEFREVWEVHRVGRLLGYQSHDKVEATLLAVGEEMRQRVQNEKMKRFVTLALDRCFEKLGPQVI